MPFWQNDHDLLHATMVTWGWNEYQNRVSTESWPWRRKFSCLDSNPRQTVISPLLYHGAIPTFSVIVPLNGQTLKLWALVKKKIFFWFSCKLYGLLYCTKCLHDRVWHYIFLLVCCLQVVTRGQHEDIWITKTKNMIHCTLYHYQLTWCTHSCFSCSSLMLHSLAIWFSGLTNGSSLAQSVRALGGFSFRLQHRGTGVMVGVPSLGLVF